MSSSFLSSHPDFTSPPPLGPLTLHPSLNNSYSNNPIEHFHFRTVQRIVKEHPKFTEAYQLPVPCFEPARALKYSLRTTPTHRPIKMSGKQTMTWNGTFTFPPLTASKRVSWSFGVELAQNLRNHSLCSWLIPQSHPLTALTPHLHRRSRRQASPRNPQSLRREA